MFGLLEIGGTAAVVPVLDAAKGESAGRTALRGGVGRRGIEDLFGTILGRGSEASAIDGTGGRFDWGAEVGAKLSGPVVKGGREGFSDKLELGKPEVPIGKDGLKPGYWIGCCRGGIDRPGGGLSKDCWGNWGSPLGGKLYPCQYIGMGSAPPAALGGRGEGPQGPIFAPG